MTRDVFVLHHKTEGILPHVSASSRNTALMMAYVLEKCGAEMTERHLQAMSEYASDRKRAVEWLSSLGFSVIPAKVKYDVPEEVKP